MPNGSHSLTHTYVQASTIRNKTAMLEMKSDGMFKRDRWKPCYVKVSSSIYLLYFKGTDDVSDKLLQQLIISNVYVLCVSVATIRTDVTT